LLMLIVYLSDVVREHYPDIPPPPDLPRPLPGPSDPGRLHVSGG
jgi:hypothetical protein